MMSLSGARGNIDQIKQLAGMRGMIDTSGKAIETDQSNLREGMNVQCYLFTAREHCRIPP